MPLLTNRFLIATAMLAAAAMLLGTAWLGDDAFITLRVIDNFVNGYGLRYNIIERVQVFTHPLWLLLLTPFYALTREAMVTTMLVSVALSLAAFWLLAARIAATIEQGCLLVLAAAASRTLYQYATSGLESPLTCLLLALLVWQLFRAQKGWFSAAIIGLLLLNRLDLAVLVGPLAGYLLMSANGQRMKVALTMILPALAWVVFSLVYYGAPFPNTAYAKLGNGYDTGQLVANGLEYARDFVLHDPLLALVIAGAIFVAMRSPDWKTGSLTLGIVLYIAYTIVIGGDFMSGRFFAAPGFLALCLVALRPAPKWLIQRVAMLVLGFLVVLGALLVERETEKSSFAIPANGITDERNYYYSYTGLLPVLSNWRGDGFIHMNPLAQGGLDLRARAQDREGATGTFGTFGDNAGMPAFYAGPAVYFLDSVGLTNAFLARLPAVPHGRVGHYRRKFPPGYLETVFGPSPATSIAALQPLLDDVTLAARAPLFAAGRWRAIGRLASGYYSWIYAARFNR